MNLSRCKGPDAQLRIKGNVRGTYRLPDSVRATRPSTELCCVPSDPRDGRLRHATLDVFDIEPLPGDHPLTRLDSVTLSAHSAFRIPEASGNLIRRALDIARDLAAGR